MKQKISLKGRALNYLAKREMSRLELSQKLAPHAESQEQLEALLDELADRNWQSDERYVENFVLARQQKYGSLRLAEELKQKGVDTTLFQETKPSTAEEAQTALMVLQKKYGHLPLSLDEKNKQMRFLAYRGFGFDVIQRAFELWKEEQS
ncbi:recombination regulator RecX [Neisseria sp. Ec49-e6-T10]|uniref:recombination regulator RecX n=1 Tax=Neisseria sp. Ec49-e6-T10 TaxID=3140744 RepID=UPI003EBD4596